ncbi:MAG: hypothetical protein JXQ75_10810 [Phycisphaerae bacterium]|nr:hypothetical protein [Phycisphaerae bacterium]
MKGLIGLAVIGVIGVGLTLWLTVWSASDPGIGIAHAFGEPTDGAIQLHVVVDMGMPIREPPRSNLKGTVFWDEWVEEHFVLRDDSGEKLEFQRRSSSTLIPDHKAGGTPEFYLMTKVRPGVSYTFDYIPRKAEPLRYRRTFVAPAEGQQMRRQTFEPVETSAG